MSENALVPATQTMLAMPRNLFLMTDQQIARIKLLAEMYAVSAFNQKKDKMKAGDFFLLMVKGCELGLPPMAAVEFISIIQGRPCLDGKGMLALINASGEMEDISINQQDSYCEVTMKRKGRSPHTERFSQEDADLMKTIEWVDNTKTTIPLSQKDNWRQQPRTMRKWRAVSACSRVVASDITGGLMTMEEMSAIMGLDVMVDDDGNMEIMPAKPTQPAPAQQPTLTIVEKPQTDQPEMDAPPVDNPTQSTAAPHWSKDREKMKLFVQTMRDNGIIEKKQGEADLLKLLDKDNWNDYAEGKSASKAIQAAVDALRQSANKPNPFAQMQSGTATSRRITYKDQHIIFHLGTDKKTDPTAIWSLGQTKLDETLNITAYKFADLTADGDYELPFAVEVAWQDKLSPQTARPYSEVTHVTADQNNIDAWLAASKPAPQPEPVKSKDVPVGADSIPF